MAWNFNVYFHGLDEMTQIQTDLSQIKSLLSQLIQQGVTTMANLDALTAEVTRNTDVDSSAIALLTGLAAQLESLKTDPVAIQTLADQLKSSSDALAAAVVANTPAAP